MNNECGTRTDAVFNSDDSVNDPSALPVTPQQHSTGALLKRKRISDEDLGENQPL